MRVAAAIPGGPLHSSEVQTPCGGADVSTTFRKTSSIPPPAYSWSAGCTARAHVHARLDLERRPGVPLGDRPAVVPVVLEHPREVPRQGLLCTSTPASRARRTEFSLQLVELATT